MIAELFYRPGTGSEFVKLPMRDDGSGGDLFSGDGVFSARVPPFPESTVVEFFVKATDGTGAARHWPALTLPDRLPAANLQYIVVGAPPPPGTPYFRLIMTFLVIRRF